MRHTLRAPLHLYNFLYRTHGTVGTLGPKPLILLHFAIFSLAEWLGTIGTHGTLDSVDSLSSSGEPLA